MIYNPRCSRCGRFTGYDSDSSTPFGTYRDYEPPDPEYYCGLCAIQLEEEAVRRGHLLTNWVSANWERRAAKRLGRVAKEVELRCSLPNGGL